MTDVHGVTPTVDGDAIRAMLVDRADRLRPQAVDIGALIARADQVRGTPSWFETVARRASAAVVIAALVVGSALVVGPLLGGPAGSTAPPGSGSASAPASADPAGVHALDPAELGELVRTRSAELAPRMVVVRGILTIANGPSGCAAPECWTGELLESGGGFTLRPTADLIADFADAGSLTVAGPFAVRFTTETAAGQPVVEVLDRLVTNQPDGWTSALSDSQGVDPDDGPVDAAVDGWLVRTPLLPCPTTAGGIVDRGDATSIRVPECLPGTFLTEHAFQPLQPDGSWIRPNDALSLSMDSYEAWAPDPAPYGEGGVVPRRAVYLLHKDPFPCNRRGLDGLCTIAGGQWRIVARLEPIPSASRPAGSDRPVSPVPSPSGDT